MRQGVIPPKPEERSAPRSGAARKAAISDSSGGSIRFAPMSSSAGGSSPNARSARAPRFSLSRSQSAPVRPLSGSLTRCCCGPCRWRSPIGYFLTYPYDDGTGKPQTGDNFEYPTFRELRAAAGDRAELIAIDRARRVGLTYTSDEAIERARLQFVSGWMFSSFALRPTVGRLLTRDDDLTPGAHPVAVLSHHYWTHRFGQDPAVAGRSFRMGNDLYEIVGVSQEGFTGTETGALTDVFVPTMMNAEAIDKSDWSWFRIWLRPKDGIAPEGLLPELQAAFSVVRAERAKSWIGPRQRIEEFVHAPLSLEPASAGASRLQTNYRRALVILGVVVGLTLLIACANVANLKTAQAVVRAREMALRVSIGAGRPRLVQLVLVESVLLALTASALGGLFAWWAAPFVAGMINPPDNPLQLILPADWRVLGFATALALGVTLLFGAAPALRASLVTPVSALKGGDDAHSRPRMMHALIAAQVAFCFLVQFVTGLFVATFDQLSNQPTGFSTDRLLALETVSRDDQPVASWDQLTERLRTVPGVESAALCGWALMTNNVWNSHIWVNGELPYDEEPYVLSVSPGWIETMRIPLVEGRDLRDDDAFPGAVLVNETFAKRYFNGRNPVGRSFEVMIKDQLVSNRIVGYVRDARYSNMREPIRSTIYVPLRVWDNKAGLRSQDWATFVVRTTTAEPVELAPRLRREVSQMGSGFRVATIRTQAELVRQHTIRERLLATLSVFFAIVALLLSAIGLYGVLNYTVLQRRREIGIRIALGAQAADVARRVATEVSLVLGLGALAGLAAGIATEQYIETLLYQVNPTDFRMLALPALTIFCAALLAALPPILQAVRINPASMLRAE